MSDSSRWSFPLQLQPAQSEVSFDLKSALDAVVALRSEVPDDAFTASILGTERLGNGVVIRDDGLILTIGYLITEAASVWLTGNDGTVLQGYPLAYDFATGFGLVQPLGHARWPALERGSSDAVVEEDDVVVIGHGGRAHSLKARSSPSANSPASGSTCWTRRCSRRRRTLNGAGRRCSTKRVS